MRNKPKYKTLLFFIKIILSPIVFVVSLLALLVTITLGLFLGISHSVKSFCINFKRRCKGKTPKLYCFSKHYISCSQNEVLETAHHLIDELRNFITQTNYDFINVHCELTEEFLTLINKDSVSKEEMYTLCRRIREVPYIKGIGTDLYLLHDWLLEKADNDV